MFKTGDTFDRFGPPEGSYVSPTGVTVVRVAKELGITDANSQPAVYSYTNRGLPYAGVTNSGVEGNALRKKVYDQTYSENLLSGSNDYHMYEVLVDNTVKGNGCVAAPVFNTSGGAIQIKLDTSITDLLENMALREVSVSEVPGYFRRNGMIRSR